MEDKEIYMEYKNKYILYVDTISGKSLWRTLTVFFRYIYILFS